MKPGSWNMFLKINFGKNNSEDWTCKRATSQIWSKDYCLCTWGAQLNGWTSLLSWRIFLLELKGERNLNCCDTFIFLFYCLLSQVTLFRALITKGALKTGTFYSSWSVVFSTAVQNQLILYILLWVWSPDVSPCEQSDSLVVRLRKHQQIFNLQRLPNCTLPSIIQCYSCEECPNKTIEQQWINHTQDAEYVMTCPRTVLRGIPPGWLQRNAGTKIQTLFAWCKHINDLLVPLY